MAMIEVFAQRAPEVSSIIFPVLTFAGYIHQQTVMTKAVGLYCVVTQPAVLTAWNRLFLPFSISRDLTYPIFILVLPGLACGGLMWHQTCTRTDKPPSPISVLSFAYDSV